MRTTLALLALSALSLTACPSSMNGADAGPAMLSGDAPFLTAAQGSVRTIVITHRAAQTQVSEPEACVVRAYLFDATVPRTLDTTATAGECTLYAASSDLALAQQSWICAGAINLSYGGNTETIGACRMAGDPVPGESPIGCGALTENQSVRVTSMDELGGDDVVTDLDTTVSMPSAVTLTQPTALGVTTWPATGDLAVAWNAAGASSALVTFEVRGGTTPTPTIVCQPRTNGQVTVPAALIDQAGFRMTDVLMRVASYRDATTTAESGKTYRVSAGFESAALLQARR